MLPVIFCSCNVEFVPTVVPAPMVPKALALVIVTMPAFWSRVIGPVKALLSEARMRLPPPSLVSSEPVRPLKWPLMVKSAPTPTVKNWRLPEGPASLTSSVIVSAVAPAPTLTVPLPETDGLPRVRGVPLSV